MVGQIQDRILNEIGFIIDNDAINSTYKFALCKGAIEISKNHAGKSYIIYNENRVIFPFSYMIGYFIKYYYPIFGHSSFIPQLQSESTKNKDLSQSAFRREFEPIINFYTNNNGFNKLWDDMMNNTIPSIIKYEWKKLCQKIYATILYQPMKYFGRTNQESFYSIFKPEPNFFCEDFYEDFPACSINRNFFSFSLEFHEIFQNISQSEKLIEKINRRWCSYTMSLIDDPNISPDLFMKILSLNNQGLSISNDILYEKRNLEIESSKGKKMFIDLFLDGREDQDFNILSRPAEEIMLSLQGIIEKTHDKLTKTESDLIKTEREFNNLELDIHRDKLELEQLLKKYGLLNSPTNVLIEHLQNQKMKIDEEISTILSKFDKENQIISEKINSLNDEKNKLKSIYTRSLELEDKKSEIIRLREKIEAYEMSQSGKHPFGYVPEPIKRFLTHCEEFSSKFLIQSIYLFLTKRDPLYKTDLSDSLPEWFISAFESWWEEKEKSLHNIRTDGRKITRNPLLFIDPGHREISLNIPIQHIQSKYPLDEVEFIVHSSSEVIFDAKYPLYHENDGYVSENLVIPISVPSDVYHVEMITQDSSKRFQPIDLFTKQKNYACFDYETGLLTSNDIGIINKSTYIISSESISINPENAIIESGILYGSWYGYNYYFVDPQYSEGASVTIESFSEIYDKSLQQYPLVSLENYHLIEKLLINNKTVICGSPPNLKLFLPYFEDLSGYRLSIHPLSHGTLNETRIYSNTEFEKYCDINKTDSTCIIPLFDEIFFGKNPVGTFAVRLKNKLKKLDQIFEFTIIPNISINFSQNLYLPSENKDPIELKIKSPGSITCSVNDPYVCQRKDDFLVILGPVTQKITGKIQIELIDNKNFKGDFSIPVPHLSWRLENPEKEIIRQIVRNKVSISDDIYYELGDGKILTLFLPEEYNGEGTISIKPGDNSIKENIKNGKAIFPIYRFNDLIEQIKENQISFIFSFESQKNNYEIELFKLNKWRISEFNIEMITDEDNRTLSIFWKEGGEAINRSLIIWKAGDGKNKPQILNNIQIPKNKQTISIIYDRKKLSPGLYYAQFYRLKDDWSPVPSIFPGENTPNIFQFTIELERSELLKEGDELLYSGNYIEAIRCYKELERINNKLLSSLWKQKIMNAFFYSARYDKLMSLFLELMEYPEDLIETDYSYIVFTLFESINMPDKLTYEIFIHVFQMIDKLLKIKERTSKIIILDKIKQLENAINACRAINEEQRAELISNYIMVKQSLEKKGQVQ